MLGVAVVKKTIEVGRREGRRIKANLESTTDMKQSKKDRSNRKKERVRRKENQMMAVLVLWN